MSGIQFALSVDVKARSRASSGPVAQGGVLEDPDRIVPVDELVATHLSVDGAGEEQERDGEPTANRQGPP